MQNNSDNNLNILSIDYDDIILNNQYSYTDYLDGGKSRNAIGDDFGVIPNEDIKENFKKTILSNLKGFHESGYQVSSFLIFSGVPIEYFNQTGPNIYSNYFGNYGKLLFEAFEENISNMYKMIQEGNGPSFLDYEYLDEYAYYFNILFSPDHPTAFKNNNLELSLDSNDLKPNPSNLFNTIELKDQFKIWDKFMINPYLGNNIGGLIFNELYFTIINLEKEDLELFLSTLNNEDIISFTNKVTIIFNFKKSNENNKILTWIYEWFNKIDNKNNPFIKYIGELLLAYTGKGSDDQVCYINEIMYKKGSEAYKINPTGGSIQRVSKDYISFTTFGGKLEGYYKIKESKLDINGYIKFMLKDYLYNGKIIGLKHLKGEINLAVQNSSKKIVKFELLKFFDDEDIVKELVGDGDGSTIIDNIYESLFRKTSGEITISKISELSLINTKQISQLGEINIGENQDLSVILEIFHSTEILAIISYDLGIDITQLSLQNQVHLLSFLWKQATEDFNQFKESLDSIQNENNKYSFLNTFLACSKTPEIGDKIIDLAKYPGSEEIFKQYSKLINLQSEVNLEDDETGAFLKTILSRGQQMLSEVYEEGKELKEGEKLEISDRYSEELVKAGAFTKKVLSNYKKGEVMSMTEFNESSPYFEIVKFQGGDLLKSTHTIDMMDDSNYLQPELFSKREYSMLYKNIQESYQENDPGAIGIITRAIPNDLQDKNNILYFIKDKKTGDPLAACKIKNSGESEIYWGSHYVEKEHRADFGLGSYLAKLAFSENQNKDITALVINNNTTLELQINIMGFIGEGITTVSDEEGSTGKLIKLRKNNNAIKSKDIEKYPNSFIKDNIGKNIDGFFIECLDSTTGENEEYINIINQYCEKGYIISRLFYEKDKNGINTKKTYLAFDINTSIKNNIKLAA